MSLRRSGDAPGPTASDSLDADRRARELEALAGGGMVDVLVVGGGIVGAWAALDAASRGLSVALVERGDLAQGTSRWSSKLAHGGLRYLAHGDVAVAWESARERAILMDVSAPHLVRALPFLIPLGGQVDRTAGAKLEVGLRLGDALRAAAGTSRRRLPPARRVSAEEARQLAPGLSDRQLRGALLHWDGQIEDDARLVLAVARTAAAYGARILTYVAATELRADGATVRNVLADAADGNGSGAGASSGADARASHVGAFDLRARHVVNATGVWAGELSGGAVRLRPSKGSHLLVPAAAVGEPRAAVNAPLPGQATRFVFAVPRPDGLVMIGITDAPYEGPIPDVAQVDADEEAFLLTSIGRVLERTPTSEDVVGRFAGLRPLLAQDDATATSDLSRRHAVVEHDGIVTVVGGKLTTARRMAQDALDQVTTRPDAGQAGPCVTHRIRLAGADRPAAAQGNALAPGVPATREQLRFAVEHELALTVEDLLDRRTRVGLVPQWRTDAFGAAHQALAGAKRAPAA